MSLPQYAANISDGFMFNEAGGLVERYRAARAAGFAAVECANPYNHKLEDLVAVLEETGLKQVLINSFPGSNKGDMGQAVLPVLEEEFEANFRKSVQYAKALNSPNVHFLAGKVPSGLSRGDCLMRYVERLKWAAKECLPRHLTVLIEPISAFVHSDYFLNNYGLAVDILAEVDCRNVKIQLDVFHFQQIHPRHDVLKWARRYRKLVGHIQVAQSPRRSEPHEAGDIAYGDILPALNDLFPDAYFGLEYKPTNSTLAGLEAGRHVSPLFDYALASSSV